MPLPYCLLNTDDKHLIFFWKARALWHVAATKEEKGGRSKPVTTVEIYNVADKGTTGMWLRVRLWSGGCVYVNAVFFLLFLFGLFCRPGNDQQPHCLHLWY